MEATVAYQDHFDPVNFTTFPEFVSKDQLMAFIVLQTVAICIFDFLTVAGNALIILSILRFRVLQTITSAFILNLAIVDFLIGVTLMPVALVTCIKQAWVFGDVFCMVSGVIDMLFPVASISTLSVIAIDRYCAIMRPLKYHSFMTHRTVAIFLVWVWFQSLLVALLPLTPWSSYSYNPSELLCLIDWQLSELSYAIVCLLICVVVPLGIMSFCYYHILRVARHHSRRVHALRVFSSAISTPNNDSDVSATRTGETSPASQSHRCHLKTKRPTGMIRVASRENKSTAMMMMVVGTFVLSWMPYITGALCKVTDPCCNWSDSYFTVSVLVAMLHSSLNPIIYGVMDRRFRGAMKAIVFCSSRASADMAVGHSCGVTTVL